jgi:3-isopropylmalate/(R)-2-methylmalate dehydratase large subunit
MSEPKTLFEKIWRRHVIKERPDGQVLLGIDRHLVHEGSFHAFDKLRRSGRGVRRPDLTFCIADHYLPTRDQLAGNPDPERNTMLQLIEKNAEEYGLSLFAAGHPDQGIVHVVGPELGLTLPGVTLVCGDSHTSTHGALGAIAFGIGASEVGHVLATQTLWQSRPKTQIIRVEGTLGPGVTAKDVILSIIAEIGADGAAGHATEFAGSAIRALSMEGRMTVCNMTIEAGGRCGMIAPDQTTLDYVQGRRHAPSGDDWARASADWLALASDDDAVFDREVTLDAAAIAPSLTWGTSPEEALPVTGTVPDPDSHADLEVRRQLAASIEYMGLTPGMRLTDIAVDRVFIGSCTNARIEDLRAAAAIAKNRQATIPAMVVPGSSAVKRQAEAEGLDRVFTAAGFEWRDSACSMCVGMNGDLVAPGERCASTSNRNFKGRQGPGSRTHLMSPAMAAAAAVTGRVADVRQLAPN